MGGTLLPKALAKLHQRFPDIHTTLDVGVNTVIHPKLFAGELDLVVSASPHDLSVLPDHIGFLPLITIESGIFAREAHPIFAQSPPDVTNLSKFQRVLYQADTDAIERLSAFLRSLGVGPPRIAIESSSLMAVVELVRSGDFLACLAAPLFGSFRDTGIRQLQTEREIWSFDAGILHHKAIATTAPFEMLKRPLLDLITAIGLQKGNRK